MSATGIIGESCIDDGTFTIEGILSKDTKNELSFNIPLTFPQGITADYKLNKKEPSKNNIACKVDRI